MKTLLPFVSVIAIVFAFIVPAQAAEKISRKSLVYKTVGKRKLEMIVHYPPAWKAFDKRASVVFFFGGGWSKGSTQQFDAQADYLASRGMVTARADYRVKTRDGVTPDKCVEDARSAVRWMRANATKLGIDPAKLVSSGGSAGGHLAACMAIEKSVDDAKDDKSISTVPVAMILFNPVLDFTHENIIRRLGDQASVARKISPLHHLNKKSPPSIIFFGTKDGLIVHGNQYWAKAKELGLRSDKFLADGQGHGFFNRGPWKEKTLFAADRFLVSLGLLKGEPTIEVPVVAPAREAAKTQQREKRSDKAERTAAGKGGDDKDQALAQLKQRIDRFYKQFDKNSDGKLSKEEYPERQLPIFDRIDANKDGFTEVEEDVKFRSRSLQARNNPRQQRPQPIKPDHANVSYGPHERNVFDLWLTKSERPTPLVIYYHGGGFRGGDKRSISPALLRALLEKGVSMAAVNYRLTDVAPYPAQMMDCARALQVIRANAKEYNIDKTRIGATGGSAGAGISMWLAFRDDLARPESNDPVARESSRVQAAVVYGGQTSYDPRFIMKLFDTDQVHPALITFFRMKNDKDLNDPEKIKLFEDASVINHATKDDAPVLLYYPQANKPLPKNSSGQQHIHHPKFGAVLKKKMDALGVECVVKHREDYVAGGSVTDDYIGFFAKHLIGRKVD